MDSRKNPNEPIFPPSLNGGRGVLILHLKFQRQPARSTFKEDSHFLEYEEEKGNLLAGETASLLYGPSVNKPYISGLAQMQ